MLLFPLSSVFFIYLGIWLTLKNVEFYEIYLNDKVNSRAKSSVTQYSYNNASVQNKWNGRVRVARSGDLYWNTGGVLHTISFTTSRKSSKFIQLFI